MADLLSLFSHWPPQAYGIWTLVLIASAYFAREYRETRKLSSEDRQARREGYAAQVEGLQAENRALRRDMADMEIRHNDYRQLCHQETDQMRRQIVVLEDEVVGLKRQITQQKISDIRTNGGGK